MQFSYLKVSKFRRVDSEFCRHIIDYSLFRSVCDYVLLRSPTIFNGEP